MLYEILAKQAQIILNLDNFADANLLDLQLAKQAEYNSRIKDCMEQKRVLHERLLLQEINADSFRVQKSVIDLELNRLKQLRSVVSAQAVQMQADENKKSARIKLAQEISSATSLTVGMADVLIDRIYVYPGDQLEVVWKMKDFCIEQ